MDLLAPKIVSLLGIVAWATTPALAQKQPHDFLKRTGGFSDSELANLDGGAVITKKLDTGVDNELVLMGAARMEGTIDEFLMLYRDIERFESKLGPAKKLSNPPKLEDLTGIEFSKGELKSLADCEVGSCDIKMGEPILVELRQKIDWSSPNVDAAVTRFLYEKILQYAVAYQKGGNAELAVYRNKSKPQVVAEEFEALLDRSSYILEYRPELHQYLLEYPKTTLPRASDFLYWSILGFGPSPTLRVNHVTIYPTKDGPNAPTIITSKQLYFSHYFDTGLELYTVLPDEDKSGEGSYLVVLNRYRTDLGGGLTGKVMRLGAAAGTEGAMKDTIKNAQAAVAQQSR